MKKLLTILSIAAVVASGTAWTGHADTELHNSANHNALSLRESQKKLAPSGVMDRNWKLFCTEALC